MTDVYVPLLSALVGALIGATASVLTVWVQARIGDRRERLRHVADLAQQDYRLRLELAQKSGRSVSCPPLVVFLHYHMELMQLLETGRLTPEALREVSEKNQALIASIKEKTEK